MTPSAPTGVRLPTGEPPEVAAEVVAVSKAMREELEQKLEDGVRFALTRVLAVVGVGFLIGYVLLAWVGWEVHKLRAEVPDLIERMGR